MTNILTNSYSYSDKSTRSSEHLSARHSHCKKLNRDKRKHPKNAIIINFSDGQHVTEGDVRRELAQFGRIRAVIMCTLDACQAFVTMHSDPECGCSARRCIARLLELTNGFLIVNGFIWSVCRPKQWKKLMDDVTPTHTEASESHVGEMVTVDQLTSIFTNFFRQNSSVSQTSIFSNSTQSSSSLSVGKARSSSGSSSSAADSCDSSITITPFTIYPAQQSTGFISLPPPYHILPDTAFFRKTKIVVPPPPAVGKSLTQRVMNRYVASMQKGDAKALRSIGNITKSSCPPLELNCSWWNPM
ncbi:unnamed protein product [Caenorhabditis sp. 36 PRJEB53466]|nr:unnamed protein product [Caenorhabditis sp. 36 PRJEB53466]